MQLAEIQIKRFRSIWEERIAVDPLTAIVGPNGSGKSTVLGALREFYSTTRSISTEDFYNRDRTQNIEITLSFSRLSANERQLFSPYINGDSLVITKIISDTTERYHGVARQHPEFLRVRAITAKRERMNAYNQCRQQVDAEGLTAVRSADEADTAMLEWELAHPELCQLLRDDGQFFGFRQVGQAKLERYTRFVLVPAVRDAEGDAADRRGSPIYELMEMVVRTVVARDQRIQELKQRTQADFEALVGPEAVPQLRGLATTLTDVLRTYVPSASVKINWGKVAEINLPIPSGEVQLVEDSFSAPVQRVGHGLQRAFILSLLQVLTSTRAEPAVQNSADAEPQEEMPELILAIEEPELYQHPNRQRHFARVLKLLANGELPGVARNTQVLYCTHSPLFVDIGMFNAVRRLSKTSHPQEPEAPKISKCNSAVAQMLAEKLQRAQTRQPRNPFTGESLIARCGHLMGPWINEGFFADVAVLVEGDEDRAAILGCAEEMSLNLESIGVAIIPVGGKSNLDRPYLVFSSIEIPTFVVFDADLDEPDEITMNRSLQKLFGIEEAAIVDFPEGGVFNAYAVMSPNMTGYLKAQSGDDAYGVAAAEFREAFGYPDVKTCQKSSRFVARVVRPLMAENERLQQLRQLVRRIASLSPHYAQPVGAP